ncbi:cysteine hydrolase [Catenulispora yoronensis]|uniref:Cysteine hydrolase n=1 Tax=Catenulispora yoronensis TaxID=450799 RepID=A0ABN2TP76_9ACTN
MTEEAPLHNWMIEEREYLRQESRRGKRHAFNHLDPARTALAVIDMVPFFADLDYVRGIVPNIMRIADALRAAGGTVAWVLPGKVGGGPSGTFAEFYGPRTAELFRSSGGTGPLRERVIPELTVRDEDLLVEKSTASAFFPGGCPLAEQLRERNVETVLITGTVANVCCESSARDASTRGFRTIMVADGNAAVRDQDLNATLHTIYRSFGDVRPTAEVLQLIAAEAR